MFINATTRQQISIYSTGPYWYLLACTPPHLEKWGYKKNLEAQNWEDGSPSHGYSVNLFRVQKVKVTRPINAHSKCPNIFWTGRPTNFKLGTQTEHEDPHQRQSPWPSRSKVKVTRSCSPSESCWPISGERKVPETPKLVGRLPTSRVIMRLAILLV